MDIMDGKELYKSWFDFKETKPLNYNFEMLDIDSMNFVGNSGSYFIFTAGILTYPCALFFINLLARFFSKYQFFRNIGLWAYRRSYLLMFKYGFLKLLLESYFDLCICAILQIYEFIQKDRGEYKFMSFFGTRDDIICSVLTFIYMVLLLFIPSYYYF